MSNCSTSLLLLAAVTVATLGCSANTFTTLQPSQASRPGIRLLPSAHTDGKGIGSLAQDSIAQPLNHGRSQHRFPEDSLHRADVSRHPFR